MNPTTFPISPPAPNPRRAVFFDRDGVLNVDSGFIHRREDFRWRPGAIESVGWLNRRGALVFVVTNQSGVARGFFAEADVLDLHAHMQAELAQRGARVDAFRYCPHHPEATVVAYRRDCACRKPRSGMIEDLLQAHGLDPARCLLFGDKTSDLEAGRGAGVPSLLAPPDRPLIDGVRAAFLQVDLQVE